VKTKKLSGILACYSGFSIKTIPQDWDEFYARFDLNGNKDIKMKTSIAAKSLKNKLWIVCWVSLLGLGACSNETQKPDDNNNNIESSEMTPVQTASEEKNQVPTPNSTEDEEGAGGTAYYSSSGSVENDQKADDTVTVNENNPNLDKASADGVQ